MTTLLSLFGCMNGFLTHLRANNLTVRSLSYTPTPFAKLTLLPTVAFAGLLGHTVGVYFYGDDGLRRLMISHVKDRKNRIDGSKYTT